MCFVLFVFGWLCFVLLVFRLVVCCFARVLFGCVLFCKWFVWLRRVVREFVLLVLCLLVSVLLVVCLVVCCSASVLFGCVSICS